MNSRVYIYVHICTQYISIAGRSERFKGVHPVEHKFNPIYPPSQRDQNVKTNIRVPSSRPPPLSPLFGKDFGRKTRTKAPSDKVGRRGTPSKIVQGRFGKRWGRDSNFSYSNSNEIQG